MAQPGLVLLDRDGVLNAVTVDPEHGTIGSPLHVTQVRMLPGVPEALARLGAAGFGLAVCTNQPGAAKGQTTRQNLDAVHERIITEAQSGGARILSSHICFHRSEDKCTCRKPRPGLLNDALAQHPQFKASDSWMVGDGVTDVEAGVAAGVRTAFLGPRKCDACKVMSDRRLDPHFWGGSLVDFVDHILTRGIA